MRLRTEVIRIPRYLAEIRSNFTRNTVLVNTHEHTDLESSHSRARLSSSRPGSEEILPYQPPAATIAPPTPCRI